MRDSTQISQSTTLLLLLTACSAHPALPTSPAQPSAIATQRPPSASPTKDCPGNTASDPPWVCVEGPATPLPTTTSPPTLKPTPTYDFRQVFTRTPPPSWPPDATGFLLSPDGRFVAIISYHHADMSAEETIEVLDVRGTSIWHIDFPLTQEDPTPYMAIDTWSEDSSALYFLYGWHPDGGDYAFWWTAYDLLRVQLPSGLVQHMIPGTRFNAFASFAISPDTRYLAYVREADDSSIIYVRDLSTGTLRRDYIIGHSDHYVRAGDITWAPSGNGLAFQVEFPDYIVRTIFLNTTTMEQKLIKQYEMESMYFQGWSADGKLDFLEWPEQQVVLVDIETGETALLGTATPRP
jgi:WD40-like Beta Propeller Repeat